MTYQQQQQQQEGLHYKNQRIKQVKKGAQDMPQRQQQTIIVPHQQASILQKRKLVQSKPSVQILQQMKRPKLDDGQSSSAMIHLVN
jgi:hypothetical protein